MIKESKPNQFTVGKVEFHKVKTLNAIKVNVTEKTIKLIPIENCIEYVQRNHDFFNYELVGYDLNAHFLNGIDCFIVGTDDDLKGDNSFTIKGCSKVFYGNAILVKIPKGGNLHKLQATKITVEDVSKVIDFNK